MLKHRMRFRTYLGLFLLLWILPLIAQAQQFEQVGPYQIHYSAVSTDFLPQSVTEAHSIQRSPALALLNVSVLEEVDGALRPVNAAVSGSVSDVRGGEATPLQFRVIREGDAQSQVAVFTLRDDEPMHFTLEVRYDRNQAPAEVNFIQRFHIQH